MGILIISANVEGAAIRIGRWSKLAVVTSALKYKVAVYHARNFDLSIHVSISVHICTELWLWIY
jgi:hypothetical protein